MSSHFLEKGIQLTKRVVSVMIALQEDIVILDSVLCDLNIVLVFIQSITNQEVIIMEKDNGFRLIKIDRMIDGTGKAIMPKTEILIKGGEIIQVGPQGSLSTPNDAFVEEIDYGNRTALPGLVDCHVHLIGIGDGRAGDELTLLPSEILTVQAAMNAKKHLDSGVTTIRDCGGKHNTTFLLRQSVEMGITEAPRLILAGRPIAIIGGHLGYFGTQATGATEGRAAVRQLVKEGADFIKITATGGSTRTSFPMRPSFTVDELTAICDEAHKFGKHTVAHCTSSEGMLNAIQAGIDTIVHGVHKEPDGTNCYRPEITEQIIERGIYVNPTLNIARVESQRLEAKKDKYGLSSDEQTQLNTIQEEREVRMEHVNQMRESGVTLVCGSDSAWGHYKMGDFQGEIESTVLSGMPPEEAIVSATLNSAKSCHYDDKVGSIEPGKKADMVIVDGNPSKNIEDLRQVVAVIKNGKTIRRNDSI